MVYIYKTIIKYITNYLTPALIFSFFALSLLLLSFYFFHLPFLTIGGLKALLFIFSLICFSVIALFYKIIFQYKKWSKISILLKQTIQLIGDFTLKTLPFFILLYVYDSIHDITHIINDKQCDGFLAGVDRFILGGRDVALLMEKIINPWLTRIFSLVYSFYFIFYLTNPIIYYFHRNKKVFDIVLTGIIIASYLGLIGYILVPCLGPIIYQNNLFTKSLVLPDGSLYVDSNNLVTDYVFSRGSFHCFPSLHFGITLVWLYYAWKYLRKEKYWKYAYYLHLLIILALWFSTLYLRWHYLIDWLGGLIVALAGIWLAPKIVNWWDKMIEKKHVGIN